MSNAPPPPSRGLAPLDRPLAGWGNDDLLVDDAERRHFEEEYPDAMPVFDWPALRARFKEHDPEAGSFRQRSRRRGMIAAACGFASLLIVALTPQLAQAGGGGDQAARWLGLAAAALALASGAIGYTGVLSGRTKWRWLNHRFWTERMRQLHFQLIVNNLPLAAKVIEGDPAAQADWDRLRARIFNAFDHHMTRNADQSLRRMRENLAEDQPWLDDDWIAAPPPPSESAGLAQLYLLLKRQRFGIQKDYTERKLQSGVYSPRTRLQWLRGAIEGMTILTLALAIALGFVLVSGAMPSSDAARLLVAIGAGLTAGVMTLRMLEEGLQLRTETERYEWYLAAVEALERRYEAAPAALKVEPLREMERLSYQELRRFTDSFCNARFVM